MKNNTTCKMIFAMDKIGRVGNGLDLPWKGDPDTKWDMKHFKDETSGNIVIMGWNTMISMRKPLKNRINIVLTKGGTELSKSADADYESFLVCPNDSTTLQQTYDDQTFYLLDSQYSLYLLCDRLHAKYPDKDIYCIGGLKTFYKFLAEPNLVSNIIITEFNKEYPGDIYFDKKLLDGWIGQYCLVPNDANGTICEYTKE